MRNALKFGFLPDPSCYSGGGLIAEPLQDFEERRSSVWSSGRVDGNWIHPPLIASQRHPPFNPVKVQSQVYTIPETHILLSDQGKRLPEDKICELVISVIGFLKGLRLIPEGWNHFYRTPARTGYLVDFDCDDSQVGNAMEQTIAFGVDHTIEICTRMFGALHWYLASQSYWHDFEVFAAQYTVLDTCWHIFCAKFERRKLRHAERLTCMCSHFGIHAPDWATIKDKESILSRLRNELVHDGYFANAPIGFEFCQEYPDIDEELRDLNSRLILALLGFRTPYVQTKINRGHRFRVVLQ
jgi:hypothetical protein